MKILWQFVGPTIQAIIKVMSLMFTTVAIAYGGIVFIAKGEAKNVEEKIIAVRTADMEHLNKRFDKLEVLIKELK
jgi:p-aminobenzoyl-glutamate transporter AbgT